MNRIFYFKNKSNDKINLYSDDVSMIIKQIGNNSITNVFYGLENLFIK